MEQLFKTFDLLHCRNEEHVQSHAEVRKLVQALPVRSPKMQGLIEAYFIYGNQEEEAIAMLRKLENTDSVTDADSARILVLRGMIKAIASMMNFPNAEKKAAATRIHLAFDGYGVNASRLTGDKSVAIKNVIKDLQTTHAADAALIGLDDWLVELIAKQTDYEMANNASYSEKAQKTRLRMVEVRVEIDTAYRALIKHIDAIIEVDGMGEYETFVRELNVRIDKMNNIIAQRKGRHAKDNEKGDVTKDK